jgi:hypothetical protein
MRRWNLLNMSGRRNNNNRKGAKQSAFGWHWNTSNANKSKYARRRLVGAQIELTSDVAIA